VTFDCYGTLVDWQNGFTSMLSSLAGHRAGDLARAYDEHERRVESERPHRSFKDVVVRTLLRSAEELGLRVSDAAARGVLDLWSMLRPFDDAEPLLAALRANGYRLAVLTNCDDDLFETTHRTFGTPFDLFVTAERVRGYKPAPWHFRAFELLTGVQRADWVHVAASRYHDIEPARALGIKHVWLDRNASLAPAATSPWYATNALAAVDAIERMMAETRIQDSGVRYQGWARNQACFIT
jgi:2-haloacid dehalogenase